MQSSKWCFTIYSHMLHARFWNHISQEIMQKHFFKTWSSSPVFSFPKSAPFPSWCLVDNDHSFENILPVKETQSGRIWMSNRDLRIGARVVLIRLNGSRGWVAAHAEHGTKTCECHHQLITILALCIFCSDRSSRKGQLWHKLFTTMIPPGFFLKCGFELSAW